LFGYVICASSVAFLSWVVPATVGLRGYPETQQQRRAYIKQHPCGNERQDDRMGRAY